MEITKVEVEALQQIVDGSKDVCALTDLELALVGGGIGDVVFV
jgi:hypothetical protein